MFAYIILSFSYVFLLNGDKITGKREEQCDWILRDAPEEGKVIHTFHTKCSAGEIKWLYPYGGMDLTFTHAKQDAHDGFRDVLKNMDDVDYDSKLLFCYVILVYDATVLIQREKDHNLYNARREACITGENRLKLYGEAFPTSLSNIYGKLEMRYEWTYRTPYEECIECSKNELSFAICTSEFVFTGKYDKTSTDHNNDYDVNNYDYIKNKKQIRFPINVHPNLHAKINGQQSSTELKIKRRSCYNDVDGLDGNRDLIFFADMRLNRLSITCSLPYKVFLKFWHNLVKKAENDCFLNL